MVYSPVLVSIEWVKEKHHVGVEKTYAPGESLIAKVWITNDLYETYEDASMSWCIRDTEGEILEQGDKIVSIPEDSSQIVENLFWSIPQSAQGNHKVEAEVKDKTGKLLSSNYFEFKVEGSRGFKK